MSKLRVLMYHKVHESERDYLTVNTQQLKQQLDFISAHYNVIRLSRLSEHIINGSPLPERPLLISFDDGYENNYRLAYPLLKAKNLPFAIFPVSGFIGKTLPYDGVDQSFLNTEQLKEMAHLADYGCHGSRHLNLTGLSKREQESEIAGSVSEMKALGIKTEAAWAYTYGSYPKKDPLAFADLKKTLNSHGIRLAFRIGNRVNTMPLKDPYKIERLDIRGNESFLKFRLKLAFGKLF